MRRLALLALQSTGRMALRSKSISITGVGDTTWESAAEVENTEALEVFLLSQAAAEVTPERTTAKKSSDTGEKRRKDRSPTQSPPQVTRRGARARLSG